MLFSIIPTNLLVHWFREFATRKNTWSSARLACWPLLHNRDLRMEVLVVLEEREGGTVVSPPWSTTHSGAQFLLTLTHCGASVKHKSNSKHFPVPYPGFPLPCSFSSCESLAWNYLEPILLRWVFLYIYNIALLQIINSFPSLAASSTYNFGKQLA